jgi:hypothetical protein
MTQDYSCEESVDWKTKITDSGYLDARLKIMKKLEGKVGVITRGNSGIWLAHGRIVQCSEKVND